MRSEETESLEELGDFEESPTPGYSIRVASRMSGLSVDTLRMWERRYDFPSPLRNDAGNRLYTEADVERLALIGRAMKLGYRAGEAIRLAEPALRKLLAQQPATRMEGGLTREGDISRLVNLLKAHDIDQFRLELRRIAGAVGVRRFVIEVSSPLVEAIGEGWSQGEIGINQEHLATEVLSSQLRALLQQQERSTGPRILFGALSREQHSIGFEMAALMASTAGARVELLGPDSPTIEVARAASALHAEAVGLSLSVASSRAGVLAQVLWLAEQLPSNLGIWVGGKGAVLLEELPARVRVIRHWQDLDDAIQGLTEGL